MHKTEENPLITFYTCQFGPLQSKGADYLQRILRRYTGNYFSTLDANYNRLISEASEEIGIQRDIMKREIRRYMEDGWKHGSHDSWNVHIGWTQDRLPDVDTAIKLVCEFFADFQNNFEADRQHAIEVLKQVLAMEGEQGEETPPASERRPTLEEIIDSDHFLSFNSEMADDYGLYLIYRVQRDLYELCQERGHFAGLSWQEFVFAMCHYKRARDAAEAVLQETINRFRANGYFNFGAEDKPLYRDSDLADIKGKETSACTALFDVDMRRELVLTVLLKAEIVQYRRQLDQGKDYSWEQYLAEMMQNGTLWDEIMLAFRDALWRLDFKSAWQSEDLEELANRMEAQ